MTETVTKTCQFDGCDREIEYSGRGKPPETCPEHAEARRRERARARAKAYRGHIKRDVIEKALVEGKITTCCADNMLAGHRTDSACGQHATMADIADEALEARFRLSAGGKCTSGEYASRNELIIRDMYSGAPDGRSWGASVRENPDSYPMMGKRKSEYGTAWLGRLDWVYGPDGDYQHLKMSLTFEHAYADADYTMREGRFRAITRPAPY